MLTRVEPESEPIESRDARDLSYDVFLRDYLRTNRPVVVHDATPLWPAMKKWTPKFFKERFGSKRVQVSYDEQLTFSEFIDGVFASTLEKPGPYMYRLFLHEELPEVLADVSPPNPYAFPRRYASRLMMEYWRRPDGYLKLLIGGAGGRFPIMHFDAENAHATITEIYGEKEFIVYAPSDSRYLYPSAKRANQSAVDDVRHQDRERFPLLEKAHQFRSVLKPGDMVFIPSGWWHTARTLSPSISVCMNMLDESNWRGFVNEVCGPLVASPRKLLKRAYFEALGALMSACERVQHHHGRLAELLSVSKLIAPDDANAAPDPSRHPLHIRVRTG